MRSSKSAEIEAMRQRVFFEQSGFCFICIEPMVLTKDRGNPHRCEASPPNSSEQTESSPLG